MKKISLQGFGLFSDPDNRVHYPAGHVLFGPGDYADRMYVIVEGELLLTQRGVEIDRMTAGEIVGEMGMIENRPRNGTVTAVTDCTLIPIDRLRFAALIRQHPGFATRIMSIISSRLERRTTSEVKRQALKRELAIGHEMQLALLPRRVPEIPGWQFACHYQSAWQVGGDFYDFITLEEDPPQLALVIADVTGKGVPAALIMAMARTLIRAEAGRSAAPAAVLERVNELIINDNRAPVFLSAYYAVLDAAQGRLRYASAGHNPPLCLRRATGQLEELPAPGYLLGAFRGASFSGEETSLAPGDALILYTDGVSEARDAAGHFFGEERLKAAVCAAAGCTAEAIVDGILAAVADFSGPRDQTDDLTIVVAKRLLA